MIINAVPNPSLRGKGYGIKVKKYALIIEKKQILCLPCDNKRELQPLSCPVIIACIKV